MNEQALVGDLPLEMPTATPFSWREWIDPPLKLALREALLDAVFYSLDASPPCLSASYRAKTDDCAELRQIGMDAWYRGDYMAAHILLSHLLEQDPTSTDLCLVAAASSATTSECWRHLKQAYQIDPQNAAVSALLRQIEHRLWLWRARRMSPVQMAQAVWGLLVSPLVRSYEYWRRQQEKARFLARLEAATQNPRVIATLLEQRQNDLTSQLIPIQLLRRLILALDTRTGRGQQIAVEFIEMFSNADLSASDEQAAIERLYEMVFNPVGSAMLTQREYSDMLDEFWNEIWGYGPLEPLMADETVTEIAVNGNWDIFIERKGHLVRVKDRFESETHAMRILNRMLMPQGLQIHAENPIVNTRLPDGSRLTAMVYPVTILSPVISIRKFPKKPLTVENLIRFGSITKDVVEFLRACIIGRLNIFVAGGPGSGKTTLINVLSSFIPNDERIISIEHVLEFMLRQEQVIFLESSRTRSSADGSQLFSQLVRNAINMRPDWLVIGKPMGGEILSVLEALSALSPGSMVELNASSPQDAIARIQTLCQVEEASLSEQSILNLIATTIDLIVQVDKMRDGTRRIVNIVEIGNAHGSAIEIQPIFTFEQTDIQGGKIVGRMRPTGYVPTFTNRIESAGVYLPKSIFGVGR